MLKWIKSHLPTAQSLKKKPVINWLSGWLKNRPYLWQFKKHTVAAGIAISFFVAFLPLPFEMLIVTLLAILFHANLPIGLISTWITNPFTLIPANYFSYKVGVWILQDTNSEFIPLEKIHFHWKSWHIFWNDLSTLLGSLSKAYVIGLPIVSISVALISYGLVYLIWTGIDFFSAK